MHTRTSFWTRRFVLLYTDAIWSVTAHIHSTIMRQQNGGTEASDSILFAVGFPCPDGQGPTARASRRVWRVIQRSVSPLLGVWPSKGWLRRYEYEMGKYYIPTTNHRVILEPGVEFAVRLKVEWQEVLVNLVLSGQYLGLHDNGILVDQDYWYCFISLYTAPLVVTERVDGWKGGMVDFIVPTQRSVQLQPLFPQFVNPALVVEDAAANVF